MSGTRHELVIVGAGPGGLAAAAHARELGLDCLLLERSNHLADTVFCYQARKHVMAEPALVPLRSELTFAAGSRELILESWRRSVEDRRLPVRFGAELVRLERQGDGSFRLGLRSGESVEAAKVVLAMGTQGNPRPLGAPGEDLPHVATRLVDPAAFNGTDIVVVGAGDSALEIAIALAPANRVSLVVRGTEITKAKASLEREVQTLERAKKLKIFFGASVTRVTASEVELKTPEGGKTVPATQLFLKLGADPPRKLLESWGVTFRGQGREARPVLSPTYESAVPGLFLIGAVAGADLIKLAINQGYEVAAAAAGRPIDPADEAVLAERLPLWSGKVAARLAALKDEHPLFAEVDELVLRELMLSAEVKRFAPGALIVRQNDYTDSLLALVGGEVGISVAPEDGGAERRVATLSAGNFFGEMGLISGRRRNATATALTAVDLIEIPRKAMLKLLAVTPALARLVDQTFLLRAFQKYLFPRTPENQLWELVTKAEALRVERGREVFREGEAGDAFYLIRHGMLKVGRASGDREIVASYLTAGNCFGEVALLDGSPRSATVTAIFASDLVRLSRADCEAFLANHPEARADLTTKLEPLRIRNLVLDATPRAGEVLHDLIQHEVVIGTDALLIDNWKCVRCNNCIKACEDVHDDGQARLSLTGIQISNVLVPNSCWQCSDPLCMLDCPPDAIVRNARGEVSIKSNCIGCGNCAKNCPYGNIFMVHPEEKKPFSWLTKLLGGKSAQVHREVAVKCDLCSNLEGGPACVRSCPTGAAIRVDPATYQRTVEDLVVTRGEL